MPLYIYKCDHCGHSEEVFKKMVALDTELESCPLCSDGRTDDGSWHRVPTLPHTDLKDFATPIEMHSVGCTSMEEIREIQTKCPDVQISDDPKHPDFGIPIARNRKQKLQVLAVAGFTERK